MVSSYSNYSTLLQNKGVFSGNKPWSSRGAYFLVTPCFLPFLLEGLTNHFEHFGTVSDAVIMVDADTRKPRSEKSVAQYISVTGTLILKGGLILHLTNCPHPPLYNT